jgi:hypothetical protein
MATVFAARMGDLLDDAVRRHTDVAYDTHRGDLAGDPAVVEADPGRFEWLVVTEAEPSRCGHVSVLTRHGVHVATADAPVVLRAPA